MVASLAGSNSYGEDAARVTAFDARDGSHALEPVSAGQVWGWEASAGLAALQNRLFVLALDRGKGNHACRARDQPSG